MMPAEASVDVLADPELAIGLADALDRLSLSELEATGCAGLDIVRLDEPRWRQLSCDVRRAFACHDHVVVRGLPATQGGKMLMAVCTIFGTRFLRYGSGQVVRHFAMSPWAQGLAQTAAEGHFHSDLNASPSPPALTAIQCVVPDPGAPAFGVNRVARVADILRELAGRCENEALAYLCDTEIELANEHSVGTWRGKIVTDGLVRFHPETIRAACRRRSVQSPEAVLESIRQAAFAVSVPINLGAGDILLLSNHRTVHYRGECSVVFRRFPSDFQARSINVLHVHDEQEIH